MNYLIVLLCTLLLGNSLSAKELVIGTSSAYAPFVSLDERGEYVGFDIDFARALAKKLDRKLVLKDLGSMPSLFLGLKKGKVDALLWAISITEERQKQVEMLYYQGQKVSSLPLLFWKQIPEGISSIEQMANSKMVISVEAGSFQENFLKTIPGINLKQVDKIQDALLEIKYGKSVATLIDPFLLKTIAPQFPELKILDVPLPISEQSFGNGICLRKDDKLITEVRRAIDELRSEGTIAELEQKWNLR